MKRLLHLSLLSALFAGCAGSRIGPPTATNLPASSSFSGVAKILTEADALRIGRGFAQEKRWEVRKIPSKANFVASQREWKMRFGIENRGGPFIVYVNDVSGAVRYVAGE